MPRLNSDINAESIRENNNMNIDFRYNQDWD